MKRHPIIEHLKQSQRPFTPFVAHLLLLYKKSLNQAYSQLGELQADFEEISILQTMVYSSTAITSQLPVTESDHELYNILVNGYEMQVEALVGRFSQGENLHPVCIAALALHRCFLEKLAAYQVRQHPVIRCILNCCTEMQKALFQPEICESKIDQMIRRYQEVCKNYPVSEGHFGKLAQALRNQDIEFIIPYAQDAILDPEHPFISDLIKAPQTPFVSNMLRLYEKILNEAYASQNDFVIASALLTMFCSALSGLIAHTYKPETEKDHELYATLSWRYYAEINKLKHKQNLSPVECSALAIHLYFSQKHATYLNHKNPLMMDKLEAARDLQQCLAQRMLGKNDFQSKVDNVIANHTHACKREGAPEGQFGLLARMIRNDSLTSRELPNLEATIGAMDPHSIRNHLHTRATAMRWCDFFNKRWLNQLADAQHKSDYYQTWTNNNPYQHAKSLALRSSCKYTMCVLGLAVVSTLVVSAAMGGIGSFLALNTAAAFIQTKPGLYVLGICGTTIVSAPLSFRYNKKEYSFKQKAIEQCVRFNLD